MSPTTATPAVGRSKSKTTAVAPSMPMRPAAPGGRVAARRAARRGWTGPSVAVGRVELVEVGEHLAQLAEEREASSSMPSSLPSWRGGHDEGDAGEVAHEHRSRQQVGERPEPEHARRPGSTRRPSGPVPPPAGRGRHRPPPASRARWPSSSRRRLRADRELRARPIKTYTVRPPITAQSAASGRYAGDLGVRHHLGIRYAVTVTPASTSPRSQPRS